MPVVAEEITLFAQNLSGSLMPRLICLQPKEVLTMLRAEACVDLMRSQLVDEVLALWLLWRQWKAANVAQPDSDVVLWFFCFQCIAKVMLQLLPDTCMHTSVRYVIASSV